MTKSVEERIRRRIVYWRVPLITIALAVFLLYVTRLDLFWYGAAVAIIGQSIQTWCGSHIRKDLQLTISGPYSHVRNPMYIGRFVLILGFVLMIGNAYLTAAYVVVFALYAHPRVLREEARLRDLFGADYERYCCQVNRWMPKLKPYSGADTRRASWEWTRRNHEDLHFAGLILILAVIYLRIALYPHPWHSVFGS